MKKAFGVLELLIVLVIIIVIYFTCFTNGTKERIENNLREGY